MPKRSKFPPMYSKAWRELTGAAPAPYLQAFLVTMESGAVYLARVMGEDSDHGEGLALSAAKEADGGQVYDSCAYPLAAELAARGEGLAELAEGVAHGD